MGRAFGIAATLAFAIDQISKYVVIHMWGLRAGQSFDVYPPYLNFIYGENCGINFGIFGDCSELGRWTLIVVGVVICVVVSLWLRRTRQPWLAMIGGGILVGGALANVLDRLLYGYVLDFLNNSLPVWNNPFVYNIADIFIFAGAFLLVLFSTDKNTPKKKAAKKPAKKRQ